MLTWKSLPGEFPNIWNATKEKQIRNWEFLGITKGDHHLEVGFWDGYNLKYLEDKGVIPEGIEINPDAVKEAK